MKQTSFTIRLFKYCQERFPIIPALLFSFLFALAGVLYVNENLKNFNIIILTMVIFLFLFRARLLDEIKDYKFDSKHYPHRPVQKGLVSMGEIKMLRDIVITGEIIIQFFLGGTALIIYAFLFFYNFLMYKNFFIKNFEKRNFFFYILLHQLIFLGYAYYVVSVAGNEILSLSFNKINIFLALFLPAYIYEIGRKCKHRVSSKGGFSNDTYIYNWGKKKTFSFLILLLLLQSFSLWLILTDLKILFLIHLIPTLLLLPAFYRDKTKTLEQADKWSMALGMLGLILTPIYLFL